METPMSYYALYHPTESLAWNVLSSDALTCRFNGDTPNTWAQACAVQYINVYHKFPMNMTWLSTFQVIPTFGQPSSESVKAVGHCRSPYSRKESWSPATLTNGAYYFKLLRCWSVEGYSNFHDFPCFLGRFNQSCLVARRCPGLQLVHSLLLIRILATHPETWPDSDKNSIQTTWI